MPNCTKHTLDYISIIQAMIFIVKAKNARSMIDEEQICIIQHQIRILDAIIGRIGSDIPGIWLVQYQNISGRSHGILYLKSSISCARIHSTKTDSICVKAINYRAGDL